MKFKHFSRKLYSKFKKSTQRIDYKPKALWLSCGNDWIEWVKIEMISDKSHMKYKYEYIFDIHTSKIIILKTYKDIKDFNEKYGVIHKKGEEGEKIDWEKVQKDYSGIFIKDANVQKARHDFLWYSSFDICSVAIWDEDAIVSVSDPNKI